jgi:hypothetical protein
MFQSIWTIFRELTLALAKVTLFQSLTPHSTGYTHSLNHDTENLLTRHFNGKISKRVTLARTNVGSLKMVHMD